MKPQINPRKTPFDLKGLSSNQALEKANKLIFVKCYEEAAEFLQELTLNPATSANLLIHLRYIELETLRGNLLKLHEFYTTTAFPKTLDKNQVIYLASLIEVYGDFVPYHQALENMENLAKKAPSSVVLTYGLGYLEERAQNTNKAILHYEASLKIDPQWYPSLFGLSQILYQQQNTERADYYFFEFEKAAPFNVYGNFETHRNLSVEFLEAEQFAKSIMAIQTLSDWWHESKGFIPDEILLYELLASSQILTKQKEPVDAAKKLEEARKLAEQLLSIATPAEENILFFVARVLEEFNQKDLATDFFKLILLSNSENVKTVQRVGSHLLNSPDIELALKVLSEVYQKFPDQSEVRFCYLVAKLKKHSVNVEEYLLARERLKSLSEKPDSQVETFALIHQLNARYSDDPEVIYEFSKLQEKMGNHAKTDELIQKLYAIDPLGSVTMLRFVQHFVKRKNFKNSSLILAELVTRIDRLSSDDRRMLRSLQIAFLLNDNSRECFDTAKTISAESLRDDPWHIPAIVESIKILSAYDNDKRQHYFFDHGLETLGGNEEKSIHWQEFDRHSLEVLNLQEFELAYQRSKLKYLFTRGDFQSLKAVVEVGSQFDAEKARTELLRLLNTNFDGPLIYWALGKLSFDLWQLQTSVMWFVEGLKLNYLQITQRALLQIELADAYIFIGDNLDKATELATSAYEIATERNKMQTQLVLAHALIKKGRIREAEAFLSDTVSSIGGHYFEQVYLCGLIHYRNGQNQLAKKIWKPLITINASGMRQHFLKVQLQKYYFDGDQYSETKNLKQLLS